MQTPYEEIDTDMTREEYELLSKHKKRYDYSMCLDCYATHIPSKKDAEGHIERTGHSVVDVYSHPGFRSGAN